MACIYKNRCIVINCGGEGDTNNSLTLPFLVKESRFETIAWLMSLYYAALEFLKN